MTKDNEDALQCADRLEAWYGKQAIGANHLRRLVADNDAQAEKLRQAWGALVDVKYGLEGARIWGGTAWTYNPLHPVKYLPLRDKAAAAIELIGPPPSTARTDGC